MVFNKGMAQPNWPSAVADSDDANQVIAQTASQDPKEYRNAFKNPELVMAVGTAENALFILLSE